jgi:hypothetical protein
MPAVLSELDAIAWTFHRLGGEVNGAERREAQQSYPTDQRCCVEPIRNGQASFDS